MAPSVLQVSGGGTCVMQVEGQCAWRRELSEQTGPTAQRMEGLTSPQLCSQSAGSGEHRRCWRSEGRLE